MLLLIPCDVFGDVIDAAVGRGSPPVAEPVIVGGRRSRRGRGGVRRLRRPLHAVEVTPAQRVRRVTRLGVPALRRVHSVRRRPVVLQARVVLLLESGRRRRRGRCFFDAGGVGRGRGRRRGGRRVEQSSRGRRRRRMLRCCGGGGSGAVDGGRGRQVAVVLLHGVHHLQMGRVDTSGS